MNIQSTKPYLIRSIFEWCVDSGFTPFISVKAYEYLDLPREYVKNGEIVFNIGNNAVQNLIIANDEISFMARFNGVLKRIEIPIAAIQGIFAKEVNQGMTFSAENAPTIHELVDDIDKLPSSNGNLTSRKIKRYNKPTLRIIK